MNILILGYTSLKRDPRIRRQIKALKDYNRVTAVGIEAPGIEGVEYKNIQFRNRLFERIIKLLLSFINLDLLYRFNIRNFPGLFRDLLASNPDLIIANDYQMLPLAVLLNKKLQCKVLFDAHEYYLDYDAVDSSFGLFLHKMKVRYIFKKYLPQIDKLTTVSDGIAGIYLENHGVSSEIIDNSPSFVDLKPVKTSGKIKLVHQGGALRKRKLEQLIEAVQILGDNYELHFYLVPTQRDYLAELKILAIGINVTFHEPVALESLPDELNKYDIGVYTLPENNLNQKFAMPNKIFEFIQARLSVAISPTTAMKQFVNEHEIGVVSDGFSGASLAGAIKVMSADDISNFKNNSDKLSRIYNSEENAKKLRTIVSSMMENNK